MQTGSPRYFSFPSVGESDPIPFSNAFVLPPIRSTTKLWGVVRKGDYVILSLKTSPLRIYCGRVVGKGVSKYNKEYDYSGAPLILYIDKVNSCNIKTIAAYSITILSEPNEVNSTVFGRFESQCSYDEALTRLNIEDLFPYNSDVDHSIHLVESTADFSFIQSLAEHHPFGEAVGEYMLVLRRNGRRVGGAVVRSGAASTKLHNAERRLFGRNLYTRLI